MSRYIFLNEENESFENDALSIFRIGGKLKITFKNTKAGKIAKKQYELLQRGIEYETDV